MEETLECPLCMETLELDDVNFFPCSCGYQTSGSSVLECLCERTEQRFGWIGDPQKDCSSLPEEVAKFISNKDIQFICRFCWHRIRTDENGLCPACRKPYSENPAEYTPLTQEQIQKVRNSKRQKNQEKRQKVVDGRKQLAELRVVQRNLVFVIGLSPRLAEPEMLKKQEYFGKFGKIHKIVVNSTNVYPGPQGPSMGAYITYYRNEDAARAIQSVNDTYVDGRFLKASFGTTKYCSNFLRNQPCHKPDCMYLHEIGEEEASFTKEDMQMGKHQTFEMMALAQVAKDNTTTRSRQKEQEAEAVLGMPVSAAVVSSVGSISPPSVISSSAVYSSSVSWGDTDSKQVGKQSSKSPPQNQGSGGTAELGIDSETGPPYVPGQEPVSGHDIGVMHTHMEQETVKQGNHVASLSVSETVGTVAESRTASAADSSFHDLVPYGMACPIPPVQQLLSDMSQLTLQLNYGALHQQIRRHEIMSPRQESDEADDDALLRDAVEAAQMLGSQMPERHDKKHGVSVGEKTEIGQLQNGIGGEVNGQTHSSDVNWSWQTADRMRRPHWNEDDLEFDPYGESAKALAELIEAEKVRVMRSVRESLEQEEESSKEERVPLWQRKGGNTDGPGHKEATAQSQTGLLHSEGYVHPNFGNQLRPRHPVIPTSCGQAVMPIHLQHAQLNGMWPNRIHKPGDGLLIQGTIGVGVPNSVPVPLGRAFSDHRPPISNSSGHMPGLPSQNFVWPDMGMVGEPSSQPPLVIRGPPPLPGLQMPPFHRHPVFGLPPKAPPMGAIPAGRFPPVSDSQRPRLLANMNAPHQENVGMYPPPGPQHFPPYLQQTVQHQPDAFVQYYGMSIPSLGAVHAVRPPVGIRPPPGIHMKPEHSQAMPYFVGGIPNPMETGGGIMNGNMPHNPTCYDKS